MQAAFAKLAGVVRFGWIRGQSTRDRTLLCYFAVKNALVQRGWRLPSFRRLVHLGLRLAPSQIVSLYLRDNVLDFSTLTEIFALETIFWPKEIKLEPPRVIYDIGANIGVMSVFFAAKYPQAQIYGFEPLPSNYQICRLNFNNVKQGRALPWAVGTVSGVIDFEFNEVDVRGGRIRGVESDCRGAFDQLVRAEVVSIDELVAARKFEPPDFLKIDVEGAEYDVLKGATNTIASVRMVHLETHGTKLAADCDLWLRERGFKVIWSYDVSPGFGLVLYQRA